MFQIQSEFLGFVSFRCRFSSDRKLTRRERQRRVKKLNALSLLSENAHPLFIRVEVYNFF